MSVMKDPAVLLEGMAERRRIDQSMLAEIMKSMAGRSLEAHGAHISKVAARLAASGAVDVDTARPLHGRFGSKGPWAFAPPTGDPWIGALAVRVGADLFLARAELSGRPDPKIDAVIDRLLGTPAEKRAERVPVVEDVRRVDVYRLPSEADPKAVLADLAAGKWREKLFGCSFSSEAYDKGGAKTGRWNPGNDSLSGEGVDRWAEAFAALRAALEVLGDPGRIVADADMIRGRAWTAYGDETPCLKHHDMAAEYGRQYASSDDYLPSANCVTGVKEFTDAQVGGDIAALADAIGRVHDACSRNGHAGEGGEFVFNDLDDRAHADGAGPRRSLRLRDQNRRHRVDILEDGNTIRFEVFSAPIDAPPAADKRLAAVELRRQGDLLATRVEKGPGIVGDDIRGWNSFTCCVESADCCLEEEYGRAPSP